VSKKEILAAPTFLIISFMEVPVDELEESIIIENMGQPTIKGGKRYFFKQR
jgi:hypothetical protein